MPPVKAPKKLLPKTIKAIMKPDTMEPYKSYNMNVPTITDSDHPKHLVGSRFDWGFVQLALNDGYRVIIAHEGWDEEVHKLKA